MRSVLFNTGKICFNISRAIMVLYDQMHFIHKACLIIFKIFLIIFSIFLVISFKYFSSHICVLTYCLIFWSRTARCAEAPCRSVGPTRRSRRLSPCIILHLIIIRMMMMMMMTMTVMMPTMMAMMAMMMTIAPPFSC